MREECKILIDEMLRFEISGIANHHGGHREPGFWQDAHGSSSCSASSPSRPPLDFVYANCRHHNTSFKMLAHLAGRPPRGQPARGLRAVLPSSTGQDGGGAGRNRPDEPQGPPAGDPLPAQPQRAAVHGDHALQQPPRAQGTGSGYAQQPPADAWCTSATTTPSRSRRSCGTGPARGCRRGTKAQLARNRRPDHPADQLRMPGWRSRPCSTRSPAAGQDLRSCFEQARRDIVIDLINDLSDGDADDPLGCGHGRRRTWPRRSTSDTAGSARASGKSRSATCTSTRNLSYLQSVGLVALVSTKIGRTYTNRVMLTFDRDRGGADLQAAVRGVESGVYA